MKMVAHAKKKIKSAGSPVSDHPLALLQEALETGSRKIHLVTCLQGLIIYGRIEGRLEEISRLDTEFGRKLVEDMERGMRDGVGLLHRTADHRILRYRLESCSESIGLRHVITPLPAIREENPGNLGELQANEPLKMVLKQFANARSGLLVAASPLRNGRRQTLSALAGEVESGNRLVLHVELSRDPRSVSYHRPTVFLDPEEPALSQLDRILRLDADALILPDIDSPKTARLALVLARGGHLVMAPITALDSRDALETLCTMISDRVALATTLHGIVSQRRLARPCARCSFRVKHVPEHPGLSDSDLNISAMRTRGGGCESCDGTGYEGWTYLYEHLPVAGHLPESVLIGSDLGRPFIASALTLPGPGLLEAGWSEVKVGGLDTDEFRHLYGNVGTRAARIEISADLPAPQAAVQARGTQSSHKFVADRAGRQPTETRDMDPEEFYSGARELLIKQIFPALLKEEEADSSALTGLALQITRSTEDGGLLLEQTINDRRSRDSIEHQFNVAVIAAATGHEMGWDRERITEVAATALIHDAGQFKADGQEEPEDRPITSIGGDRARKTFTDLAGMAKRLLQVEERENGSGAPDGLSGGEIDPVAKLIGMVDTLENLHHPVKPNAFKHTFDIIQHMMKEQKDLYDKVMFQSLVRTLSLFPVGSLVRLNNGSTAKVVSVNTENFYRPKVAVIETTGGTLVQSEEVVDLADSPFIYITGAEPLPDKAGPAPGENR